MSAEDFVMQSHGLASPAMQGPAKGLTKWFFYPGFVNGTGGLIRETDLKQRQSAFDRNAWLARYAPEISKTRTHPQTRWISLFCYEPYALQDLLKQLVIDKTPTNLLVTQGRSQQAVAQALNVLEIGVQDGGSIKLWHDYFQNATIYGLDVKKISDTWDGIKNNKRICVEGRDIASKILAKSPRYDLAFYFKCNLKVASYRRWLDIKKKVPLKDVLRSLSKRTLMDKKRKNSPLIKVKDAILIRTDKLSKKEVLLKMSKYVDRLN